MSSARLQAPDAVRHQHELALRAQEFVPLTVHDAPYMHFDMLCLPAASSRSSRAAGTDALSGAIRAAAALTRVRWHRSHSCALRTGSHATRSTRR